MSNEKGIISKNWSGVGTTGTVDFRIQIKGDINVGKLKILPTLSKTIPQPYSDTQIQLDLKNSSDDAPEQFQPVDFTEPFSKKYESALILVNGKIHETVPIKWNH